MSTASQLRTAGLHSRLRQEKAEKDLCRHPSELSRFLFGSGLVAMHTPASFKITILVLWVVFSKGWVQLYRPLFLNKCLIWTNSGHFSGTWGYTQS